MVDELCTQSGHRICVQLCDILGYLHHREAPVIHRDVKPQNVIVRPDGRITLIDFDIARVHRGDRDTDTMFFGTLAYAPPEQYGFSQTDERADIYALGVLLRWLLTGSTRENPNVRVYGPLAKIIARCTAFAPKDRYSDAAQVKQALLRANPKAQTMRMLRLTLCAVLAAALLGFAGWEVYRAVTYSPFTSDAVPAYLTDEERLSDAVAYLKTKYDTSLFDDTGETATIGDLRAAMIELYGLDLKSMLSGEEMRLLLTDLNTVAGKAPGEGKAVVLTTAQMVKESGVIPVQGLDLCIAAVQDSLQTFAAFGMVPAGHAALLEKLKQMKTSI